MKILMDFSIDTNNLDISDITSSYIAYYLEWDSLSIPDRISLLKLSHLYGYESEEDALELIELSHAVTLFSKVDNMKTECQKIYVFVSTFHIGEDDRETFIPLFSLSDTELHKKAPYYNLTEVELTQYERVNLLSLLIPN